MPTAALILQEADGSTRELPLLADQVVLGRDPACDIVVPGRLISRRHAGITRSGQVYTVEDLQSHNGTTVNGQPLDAPRVLRDGDLIELGGVAKLTFADDDATRTRPMPAAVGVWLDHAAQDVWVDSQRLTPRVSPAQFELLRLLAGRANQICSREEIVAAIWPDTAGGVSDEAIDALIKRVRARLGEAPGGERYLVTLRGRGVMLRSAARDT
jgi:DNA-binding response OmpR family regulator